MNASSLPRHPVATRTSTSGHDSHGAFPPAKSRPAQVTPSKFDGPSEEKKKTSTVTKRSWTEIEDEQLKNLVKQHGLSNWTTVADSLDGRTGKQCRERWTNHLNPGIKKGNWTDEEDRIIIEKQAELGNQWSKITEYLQGRTDNAVKNRWHSTMRSRSRNNTSHTSQVSSVNAPINITSSGHHLNPNAPANLNKRPHPAGHLNVAPKPMLAIPSFPNSTNPQLHLRKKRPNREAGYLPGAMSLKKHRPPQISIPNVPSSDSGDHVRLDDSLDPLLPFPLKPGDGEICPLTPASEKNFFNCRILSPMLSPPLVMADTHVPVTPNCMLSPLGSCMTPLPETALDEYYKSIESGSRIGTDASKKFELLSPAPLHFSTATRFQQS